MAYYDIVIVKDGGKVVIRNGVSWRFQTGGVLLYLATRTATFGSHCFPV
jgi:hypothetical protein